MLIWLDILERMYVTWVLRHICVYIIIYIIIYIIYIIYIYYSVWQFGQFLYPLLMSSVPCSWLEPPNELWTPHSNSKESALGCISGKDCLLVCINYFWIASGKRLHSELENHQFQWVNPLFLWPFSIAMLNYQRVAILVHVKMITNPHQRFRGSEKKPPFSQSQSGEIIGPPKRSLKKGPKRIQPVTQPDMHFFGGEYEFHP